MPTQQNSDSVKDGKEQMGLGVKAASAAKWSFASQIAAKLVSPLTTMILARLLTPEAFGVVASVTMVRYRQESCALFRQPHKPAVRCGYPSSRVTSR